MQLATCQLSCQRPRTTASLTSYPQAHTLILHRKCPPIASGLAGQQGFSLACRSVAEDTTIALRKQRLQRRRKEGSSSTLRVEAEDIDTTTSISTDEDLALPPLVDKHYLSDIKFAEFQISPKSKRALSEVLHYERCSRVQAAAIPLCLGPVDVVAKAKTGTGKTLAFVIPVIEKVLADPAPRGKVSALILSPTRELARQIGVETSKMLTFHPGLHSMVVHGGVDSRRDVRELAARLPDILIATPGRCWDLVNNRQPGPGGLALGSMLSAVRVLVLDEADNLLDMGFRPQIANILRDLPPTSRRQTLLFSATFPEDVEALAGVALKRQHEYVDAVGRDAPATHTHVEACCLVVPLEQLREQLLGLMTEHMVEEPEYKIIVFLPTAHLTAYFAKLFALAGLKKAGLLEIHSRKAQSARDRASAAFRAGSRLVLFSSDVSARGVDYPNVTLVVQVGAPSSRDQYIHRLGRTGRAGRPGRAALLLAEGFEERLLAKQLAGLPLPLRRADPPTTTSLTAAADDCPPHPEHKPQGPQHQLQVEVPNATWAGLMSEALATRPQVAFARAADRMDREEALVAFKSLLGYYRGHQDLKLSPTQLVSLINTYAVGVLGCCTPPLLTAHFAKKMGIAGAPGVVLSGGPGGGGDADEGEADFEDAKEGARRRERPQGGPGRRGSGGRGGGGLGGAGGGGWRDGRSRADREGGGRGSRGRGGGGRGLRPGARQER